MSLDDDLSAEQVNNVKRFIALVEERKKREALVLYQRMTRNEQETIRTKHDLYLKVAQMQF